MDGAPALEVFHMGVVDQVLWKGKKQEGATNPPGCLKRGPGKVAPASPGILLNAKTQVSLFPPQASSQSLRSYILIMSLLIHVHIGVLT